MVLAYRKEETTFTINPARPGHIAEMLELWAGIDEFTSTIADSSQAVEQVLTRNPQTCLLAWQNGRLIGTVLGTWDGWRGNIYHLAVHRDYRGQGVGQALLQSSLQGLFAAGAARVNLYAYVHNQKAVEFYRRHGWRERTDLIMFSRDPVSGDGSL